VKRLSALLLALVFAGTAGAQEVPPISDELMQSAENWMRDNLDDDVVRALDQVVDRDRLRAFLAEVERRFTNTSVYDLGALKETAAQWLPVLRQFEETEPYAAWLQTRLDYLDAAEQMRREVKPGPGPPEKPAPLPGPSPQIQRSVWTRELEQRPLPPFARDQVPRLKPVFFAERTPPELVWVAEVESSFNPDARSPAGAAGMFQLTRPTARRLGLSTWLPDERLNAEKSARVAARHLRSLYDRYGDWRLALAAYNAGEGRVDNLLGKARTRSFDAIASRLPAETQMYVPKCEATLQKREGLRLAELKFPKPENAPHR
jgi:membrane-bound lytic murein transglycosylase D